MAKTVGLIDGDGLLYRCAAAVEKEVYLVRDSRGFVEFQYAKEADEHIKQRGGVRWHRKDLGSEDSAVTALEGTLERIISVLGGPWRMYVGDTGPTFRDSIARLNRYKAGRKPKPFYYQALRERVIEKYGAVVTKYEEVDDVIAYTARDLRTSGDGSIVVSTDKDLRQVPGPWYEWVKGVWGSVSDSDADEALWVQCLSGDPTDNIGGCWRVGEVKARAAIRAAVKEHGSDFEGIWGYIVDMYDISTDLPNCPYREYVASGVAQENYNLVRLKQDKDEWPEPVKHVQRTLTLAQSA